MTKILLLGSNGQLGSDLQRLLKETTSTLELIYLTRSQLDVSDVASINTTLSGINFDWLINCTSYHKTDEVETHADQAFKINAFAVKALSQCCANKQAKFIHISTDYVFSGQTNLPYVETDGIGPVNVYGASKAMGENLALIYNCNTYILRVASLFGIAGASGKGGNFVETIIKAGKEKGELNVVNEIMMSPTSTYEVAKIIFAIIQKNPVAGIYHAVNSGQASWYEFAKAIIEMAGVAAKVNPVPSSAYPTLALRPTFSVLNNAKLSKITGPIPHWTEALDQYLKDKGHK